MPSHPASRRSLAVGHAADRAAAVKFGLRMIRGARWPGACCRYATHPRLRPEQRLGTLVARFSQIEGYRCLSLMRALGVVKCQFALVWLALRSCSQAAIS